VPSVSRALFLAALLGPLTVHAAGCTRAAEPGDSARVPEGARQQSSACPASLPPTETLPNTPLDRERLDYWLSAFPGAELDRVLLDTPALRSLDSALRYGQDGAPRSTALSFPLPEPEQRRLLDAHLAFWRERFASGEYGVRDGDAKAIFAAQTAFPFTPSPGQHGGLRVALEEAQLLCVPMTETVLRLKGDLRFDRNACSRVRAQEPVEVLGEFGPDYLVVRSRDALAFLPAKAKLVSPVSDAHAEALRSGRERELSVDVERAGVRLAKGTRVAVDTQGRAFIAGIGGGPFPLEASEAAPPQRPLTRRAFFEQAFRYLHAPYGLGDERGGRDCSRYVSDVMRSFGLHVPRLSAEQSSAGDYAIEVPSDASDADRLAILDEASARGVVLLHFPGHIMFYIGRDKDGVPRAIHAFAEYLTPCAGGGETLHEVAGVRVSDLSLGKGTSRKSFLERMTRLTVFGAAPSPAVLGLARFRRPAPVPDSTRCEQGSDATLFATPRAAVAGEKLRFVAVSGRELRPADVFVTGPGGEPVGSTTSDLGIGPFARVAEAQASAPGTYTARLADGPRTLACTRIEVRREPRGASSPSAPRTGEAPAWVDRNTWSPAYEQLYAAFVEQLFSYPLDEQKSFANLSELVHDPARNLLYDYREPGEDARLPLSPDCADLPYYLRAYFAFKLSLPFGFRKCSRGRQGSPPRCGELVDNRAPVAGSDAVQAFERFARTLVANGVHSASGRTLPGDADTDLYPLPLSHEALAPGSVFVDPYGHLIVVAKWLPEASAGSGVLLGADAQPDHMVGRRRFWRGNFLFTPDLHDVGAGFKAFRPVVREADGTLSALDDAAIAKRWPQRAPSRVQYAGDAHAFYERMDALIHPRPLSAMGRLKELASALHEQVQRRVEAVDLGEDYMKKHPGVMAMPAPSGIFETTGPWEDFATPSRDMRLLIALDAVLSLPRSVAENPARYAVDAASVAALPAALEAELGARTVRYTRSDGKPQELTLADVARRAGALELGYNPNDCVELRWGASPGDPEAESCARHAPEEQRATMQRVRGWFHSRTRPPRP
jgi:NlpC/P60 family